MVLRWRDVDPLGRQKDVLELVKLIRLPLISPKDLFSLVKPSGLVSLEALFEAMAYHANPRCIRKNYKISSPHPLWEDK